MAGRTHNALWLLHKHQVVFCVHHLHVFPGLTQQIPTRQNCKVLLWAGKDNGNVYLPLSIHDSRCFPLEHIASRSITPHIPEPPWQGIAAICSYFDPTSRQSRPTSQAPRPSCQVQKAEDLSQAAAARAGPFWYLISRYRSQS